MKLRYLFTLLFFALSMNAKVRKSQKQEIAECLAKGKPTKLIKTMDFEEAAHAKAFYESTGETDLVTKALERMLVTKAHPHEMKKARMELAQIYQKEGKSEKALKLYQEFIQLYPGSEESKEARAQSIKINFSLTNDYTRDQTKTHETIERATTFLEDEIEGSLSKKEVEEVLNNCYEKLVDHDIYVCEQYLSQFAYSENVKDLNAARYRLNLTKKKYLPHVESKRKEVDRLEQKINTLNPEDNAPKTEESSDDEQTKKIAAADII